MPVLSPRRSSTSGSGSLYGTTSTVGGSSSSASSYNSSVSSYLSRASSLSKTLSPPLSTYSPSYLSSYSTYSPRSSIGRSNTPSWYLSGGSAGLGTYRSTSSYLGAGSNDSTSSRYGLVKKPKASDTLKKKKDDNKSSNSNEAKKPPSGSEASKRLSGSYSSSSLARLVATSGLDMYQKYSPANYKPNCELSRSRSALTEADVTSASSTSAVGTETDNTPSRNDTTTNVTLDRPRSRYSRLYSDGSGNDRKNDTESSDSIRTHRISYHGSSTKLANSSSVTSAISNSSSCGDVPTMTFTLRNNCLSKVRDDNVVLKNGVAEQSGAVGNSDNSDAVETIVATHIQLKELKLSSSGSSLNTERKGSNAITTSNSSNSISSNTRNKSNVSKSSSSADVGDQGGADANTNVTKSSGGDININTTLKLVDMPSAKKIRSAALRSIPPPPPSPAAARYWDRDSNRTSSTLLSSSVVNSTDEVSKSSSSDEKSEGLCGLRNIGNTCFMNSVIQCLSHTSELTKFLRTHNGIRSTSSKDQLILYEFAKLIREMWTSNVHSVTPMELKRAFSTKHRMYSDYNQQDAQEFLRFFLDSLHSALNTGVKGEPLKIDDNLSDNKKADLTWEWYARHENSLIRDLFVGQLKSTLRCTTCGNTSVTFDPFWDLSVPLPSSSRCKLDACLDLFIREEVLDGDEMPTCSKCRARRRCTKSFTIQRFPKYLVIHLKRFSETRWSKMSNIVEFPTGERELNMGPYGSNPNTNMYYSLYAISNHMGSTAGGHYVALCKHPVSKKWHEFNDNIVSESLSENHLVSSSAYILFYERA